MRPAGPLVAPRPDCECSWLRKPTAGADNLNRCAPAGADEAPQSMRSLRRPRLACETMSAASVSRTEVEVEWQLDALDLRPVERWFAARFGHDTTAASADGSASPSASGPPSSSGPPIGVPGFDAVAQPAKRLFDTYFDTEDWRLARAGYVLRTRRRGGGLEATMKDLTSATDGLRRRMEATETLSGAGIDELNDAGPVGPRGPPRPRRRPAPQRRARGADAPLLFSLVVHEERIGEVALDATTIVLTGDPQRLRLQRVEIEVLASVGRLAAALRRAAPPRTRGLQPATLSKFEAGLMAAGVALPGRLDQGGPPVGPETSLGELAFTVIGRDTSHMLKHEPGTRLGEDPEGLHQMRVATRRLRAALDLFVLALPARARSCEPSWAGSPTILGTVRDLDIQRGKLEEWCQILPGEHGQALDDLGDLLAAHRDLARVRLLEALDSPIRALGRRARNHDPGRRPAAIGRRRTPAAAALPELIGERHRAAVRAAKRAQTSRLLSDFHRLRIRCKRLRYAIEFTAGIYGNDVKRFAKEVASLQDSLGLIQDAEVAYAAPPLDRHNSRGRRSFSRNCLCDGDGWRTEPRGGRAPAGGAACPGRHVAGSGLAPRRSSSRGRKGGPHRAARTSRRICDGPGGQQTPAPAERTTPTAAKGRKKSEPPALNGGPSEDGSSAAPAPVASRTRSR